jgi:hypothetical protein
VAPPAYRLIGVVLVVRHGDRSPMYTLPNHVGPLLSCTMLPAASPSAGNRSPVWKFSDDVGEVHQYVTAMQSVIRLNSSQSSKLFHRFGLYPRSTVCTGAQLTAKGAVQIFRLGKFLRSRYQALLESSVRAGEHEVTPRIYVRSTEYPRTFQSAVALVYGLSGVSGMFSSRFETTRNIYFCSEAVTNLACSCVAAAKMMSAIRHSRAYSSQERQLRVKIGRILNVTANSLPWMPAMMEVRIT